MFVQGSRTAVYASRQPPYDENSQTNGKQPTVEAHRIEAFCRCPRRRTMAREDRSM